MMDAVFIIDQDYDTFPQAWTDLKRLFSISKEVPKVESLRVTLTADFARKWLEAKAFAHERGWQFKGEPKEQFLFELSKQGNILSQASIPFRVTCERLSKAESYELRSMSSYPPFVSIPFEDKVQNARRFFPKFKTTFAKVLKTSENKMEDLLQAFYLHCEKYLQEEKPFPISIKNKFSWASQEGNEFIWIPKLGTVGRHEIFSSLHVLHGQNDLVELARLLGTLGEIGKTTPSELFFQFFSLSEKSFEMTMPDAYLFEMTFQYVPLLFTQAENTIHQLCSHPDVGQRITDTFSVFEQAVPALGKNGSAIYTLRKTSGRGYEIRINLIWEEESVNPETLIAPLEQAMGLSWARIV